MVVKWENEYKDWSLTIENHSSSMESKYDLGVLYFDVWPEASWLGFDEMFDNIDGDSIIIRDDVGIAGATTVVTNGLYIDGQLLVGRCLINGAVRQNSRKMGLARKMMDEGRAMGGITYGVGLTEAYQATAKACGRHSSSSPTLRLAVFSPAKIAKMMGVPKWKSLLMYPIVKIATGLSGAAVWLFRRFVGNTVSGFIGRSLDMFIPNVDYQWNAFLGGNGIFTERTNEGLNKKFFVGGHNKSDVYLFTYRGEAVGYIAYRVSKHKGARIGRIVDIVYKPQLGYRLVEFMVGMAVSELKKMAVDGIVGIASDSTISLAMMSHNMIFTRPQRSHIDLSAHEVQRITDKYDNFWYITLADADLDYYW